MSFIMFLIGTHLIIPKVADVTVTFGSLTANVVSCAVHNCLSTSTNTSGSLKNLSFGDQANREFVPPNYSGPDSVHGSGTR
ncbi:hypothetical protein G7B40_034810 [Aetokthonos hydrillicola Thurmond2011]|uniref:Uncharacterized protein n=1 Tax=Aetokthonos hydrillicola Thurmond2011 TaxID=2712845 RepID=A0AAP5IDM5_9CYAN|nr:hypothetical protein [Aetokthonos hydrillicola]MDR9899693.1 hypothetical protein [Aetokthonos hydrillicola Thurmond2011]